MGLAKRAVVFLMMIMMGISRLSIVVVYKVGDSVGWTILGGGLDYQDFKPCNPESPMKQFHFFTVLHSLG